jgi:uncharacterized flavoprotein (TIGR03862 family)
LKRSVAIVGGGASALMLAAELDPNKFGVTIYERNSALGRKFLVAGDGGFNLTHSEKAEQFIKRYTPHDFLEKAFAYFSNADLIQWLKDLGIETYVGSSGRVFPLRGVKPVQVLDKILTKIKSRSVQVKYRYEWKGFENDHLLFEHEGNFIHVKTDIAVFCLGGASWPVTGSKGEWLKFFGQKNISVRPFSASNCAFKVDWNKSFIDKYQGSALKNIELSCGSKKHAGEIVLTQFGIEGSGIYPLSPQIRQQLNTAGKATVSIDLKPPYHYDILVRKLKDSKGNTTDILKNEIGLNALQIQLIKTFIPKEIFLDHGKLANKIKNFEISITGTAPIEDAISTVGGIDLSEISSNFELKKMPQHFVIGEMLDYDAPTGGYLLQSCFSMGKYLAGHLNLNSSDLD